MANKPLTPETRLIRPAPNSPDDVYHRWWVARVKSRIVIDAKGCWLWTGSRNQRGYGQSQYRGKTKLLHRQMYKVVRGVSLPRKQYVCHHCDERLCCNPDHLFVGTQSDNMADSVRKGRHAEQLVTHCPKNHAYDAENTYIYTKPDGRKARDCRACQRARQRVVAGWPEDLAYSMPSVPHGQRPVNARGYAKRRRHAQSV